MNLLARAIGRRLRSLNGISAAYLPDGLPPEAAVTIVNEANAGTQGPHPMALLISSRESHVRKGAIGDKEAIKYRQGHRLAVVAAGENPAASFTQAFTSVLASDFPAGVDQSTPTLGFRALADAILTFPPQLQNDSLYWNRGAAQLRLAHCLEAVRDAYEADSSSGKSWNALWYAHCEQALQNLFAVLNDPQGASLAPNIDKHFEQFTYAAFALPVPSKGVQLNIPGRRIMDAVATWWSSEEQLEYTGRHLDLHPETSGKGLAAHPVSTMSWAGFDELSAAYETPFLALASRPEPANLLRSFAALSEAQFENPVGNDNQNALLVVEGPDCERFALGPSAQLGPFLVLVDDDAGNQVVSEEFRVRIPTSTAVDPGLLNSTTLAVVSKTSGANLSGHLEVEASQLYFFGRLTVTRKKVDAKRPTVKLALVMAPGDTLAGVAHERATCDVLVADPRQPGLVMTSIKKNGRAGRPQVFRASTPLPSVEGPASAENETIEIDVPSIEESLRFTLWGSSLAHMSASNGGPVQAEGRPQLGEVAFLPSGDDLVSIGEATFRFSADTNRDKSLSPLVAAISKELPSDRADLPASLTGSVQGAYEGLVAANLENDLWTASLWHVACSEDHPHAMTGLKTSPEGGPLVPSQIADAWKTNVEFHVLPKVAESEEAERFRSAFRTVNDVMQRAAQRQSASGGILAWPSRRSWRRLWAEYRSDLAEYLNSYSSLVALARSSNDPSTIFWATYPFSVSSWKTSTSGKCTSVLLSPLHPVRLAWLAGVEAVLWDSPTSSELVGTVEGWNFPLLGPKGSGQARMLAIPIDNGEDQLFLGWSMLVAASAEDHAKLDPPTKFGDFPSPASSGSGLNGPAVDSALRAYRRMHPHVSTLSIDLASATSGQRLGEVDNAVLQVVRSWTRDKSGSTPVGGIRVQDSLNRTGDIPRDALRTVLATGVEVPVAWSRYKPGVGPSASNLRVLQDAAVSVLVSSHGESANGVAAAWPLRRFEAFGADRSLAKESQSSPAIAGGGWAPFLDALRELEWGDNRPRVSSKLHHSAILDGNADWTVCGEGMMNPNALAELLDSSAGGRQMLWEWRPPYLAAAGDALRLERRPFISVARVPSSFKATLGKLVEKASGTKSHDDVERLLGRLGARGVGLSALLSMGGTHAAGAIGFDRALSLLDTFKHPDDVLLVLPIDACDTFLRALSGESSHGADNRRADLLVMRLGVDQVTLVPIEIKCYGLQAENPGGHLPARGSDRLDEAMAQLRSTDVLLASLEARWNQLVGPEGDAASIALWSNSMATLIETGLRLSPRPSVSSQAIAERLQKVLRGGLPIRAGRPLVTFFQHGGSTPAGAGWATFKDGADDGRTEIGVMTANLESAFAADGSEGSLLAAWAELIEWATSVAELSPAGGDDANAAAAPLDRDTTPETAPALERATHSRNRSAGPDLSHPVPGSPVAFEFVAPERDYAVEDNSNRVTDSEERIAGSSMPAAEVPDVIEPDPGPTRTDLAKPDANFGARFRVGRALDSFAGEDLFFWPGNTDLNQMNVGVVGDLGTGKTQLLKSLILNLKTSSDETQTNPLSFLIFDYKRDFQSEDFIAATGAEVLSLHETPINYFELKGDYTKKKSFQRSKSFFNVISKIYKGVGPVQDHVFSKAVTTLYAENGGAAPLLSEVSEAYDAMIGKPDSVSSILESFVMNEVFSEDRSSVVDFGSLIDGKVIVVALDKLGTDQNLKNAVVTLFLDLYYEYMLGATKWPFEGTDPQLRKLNSFLMVDEATNIMQYEFPVLMQILLQGREFGFGTILASQYLSHFTTPSENYGEPLRTWFLHRVPQASPAALAKVGLKDLPADAAASISDLGVHEMVYRSLGVPGRVARGVPFYELWAQSHLGTGV